MWNKTTVAGRVLVTRLVNSVVVMAAVALLTFALVDLAPGSFLDELAANPQISASTIQRLNQQYGLDRPFYQKFWSWARGAVRGDFGYSYVYQRPVARLVGERIWKTVALNLAALAVAWSSGMALGLAAAARRGSVVDWIVGAGTAVLLAAPVLVVSVLVLALATRMAWPIGGNFVLPMLVVAAAWLPGIARHTRAAILAVLDAPHMLAARARGVSRRRLLLVHALREALPPLTGLFGLSVSALLSASLLVEIVMGWPGIGQLMYDAVLKRDLFLVIDLVQLSALLLLAGNIAGDFLLHASDPRTDA